ncbi:MAG: YbgC/FadM family acyl-CoA thioesterase [Elusimicrobiota bacterium]
MPESTVLIIDDDQTLVAALKEGLESLGYKVSAAYDGVQGILQAHQGRPQVIMLDFNMPAGGGAGVYERLRGSVDTARIPIIFLTGATVDDVKKQIRSTPNTYFLKKPVSVSQLRKVLEKILGAQKLGGQPATASPAAGIEPAATGDAPFAGLVMPGPGGTPQAAKPPAAAPPPPAPLPKAKAPASKPLGRPAPAPAPAPQTPAPAGAPGKSYEFELRASYADTDRLGIVYYANYFKYFEVGRTELLRMMGVRYRDLEMERHLFMPAVETRCEYLAPAHYDEVLRVKTWISWMGPASLCFQNEIYDKDSHDKLIARGFSRHAVLNEYWKPTRLPKDLRELFSRFMIR